VPCQHAADALLRRALSCRMPRLRQCRCYDTRARAFARARKSAMRAAACTCEAAPRAIVASAPFCARSSIMRMPLLFWHLLAPRSVFLMLEDALRPRYVYDAYELPPPPMPRCCPRVAAYAMMPSRRHDILHMMAISRLILLIRVQAVSECRCRAPLIMSL